MSAVCGYISFGRPPAPADLDPVLARLAFRGPDGCRVRTAPGAVLGHALLATTPEAEVEIQPWEHRESGCAITADARLDNRDELAAALSVDLAARVVGDAELILRAWLRWGDDCPRRLLGDFAFAIWDPRARRLFAARDQMGMRQLIWGMPRPDTLVFATDARAVRAAAPDRFPLNEARIADYLDDLECIDHEVTFFEGISRLPPAHRLSFDRAGVRIDRYWMLEAPPLRTGLSGTDHEQAFLEVFRMAVAARLRSNRPVVSMLSGGLDSTSITAVAAECLARQGRGPLSTVSAVGPDPASCPETRAAHAAWTMPDIDPHAVDHTRLDDLMPALVEQVREVGEPFDVHMNLIRAVYLRSAGLGARVVLDGVASDLVLSPGDHRARLLKRGRLAGLWRDIRGEQTFSPGEGPSIARGFAAAAWAAIVPEPVRMLRSELIGRRSDRSANPLIGAEFGKRIDLAGRRRRARETARRPGSRLRSTLHPALTVGRERYDRVAAQSGIEPRDPYMDVRVMEHALGIPPEFLQSGGWPKALLRRAMAGRVPDAVRWRRGRFHLGPLFTTAVLAHTNSEVDSRRLLAWVRPDADVRSSGKERSDAHQMMVALDLYVRQIHFDEERL